MSEQTRGLVPRLRFPEFREAGEWELTKLDNIAGLINERAENKKLTPMSITAGVGLISQLEKFGRVIAGSQYRNYIVIHNQDFAYNKSATKDYPEGFIDMYSGAVPVAVPNSIFTCFRVNGEKALPKLLYFQFLNNLHGKWLRNFITVGARAHGSLNIDNKDFLATPVPLPKGELSLLEQQKIASCLSSLDALIAAQADKLDALKTHKKGLMQQLFPREGETVPRLRFPEFREAGEWEEKQIGDLKPFVTSGSRGWAAFYSNQGSLFVRITNLSRESIYLDLTNKKFVRLPAEANEGVRTQLEECDVLISITADIGIIGYVDANVPSPSYINQHIALVRFNASQVNSKFVSYFLASERSQRLFRASTDIGTKAGMNLIEIQKIQVVLPTLLEQKQIASCFSSLDALIAAQADKLDALKIHKKGLMQQLFPSPEAMDA